MDVVDCSKTDAQFVLQAWANIAVGFCFKHLYMNWRQCHLTIYLQEVNVVSLAHLSAHHVAYLFVYCLVGNATAIDTNFAHCLPKGERTIGNWSWFCKLILQRHWGCWFYSFVRYNNAREITLPSLKRFSQGITEWNLTKHFTCSASLNSMSVAQARARTFLKPLTTEWGTLARVG